MISAPTTWATESVSFDEDRHLYAFDGNPPIPVPGVTSVLSGLGLVDTTFFTDAHRFRGKAVHAAVQYYLEDDLDLSTLSPGLRGYVEAAIRFIDEAKLEVEHVEQRVASPRHRFAGTLDFNGKVVGEPTIVDWKSGGIAETTGLQLAGYEICLREADYGAAITRRRIGVQLRKDGTFKRHDFTAHTDERRFLAALDLYRAFVWPREEKYATQR